MHAQTLEETGELIEVGFEFVTEMNDKKIFSKRSDISRKIWGKAEKLERKFYIAT